MAKSKIIKEFIHEEISLTIALKRLKLFAKSLDNHDLLEWVNHELTGYADNMDNLPKYTKISSTTFLYSSINGNCIVKNQPLNIL